jgi:hypothetical protein
VLLGTALGGVLVSPGLLALAQGAGGLVRATQAGSLFGAFAIVLGLYALAGLLNLGVPDTGARSRVRSLHPAALVREFIVASRRLWSDRDGGLSLAVTTIFWGVGATLQFAVLRWAGERMHLSLDRAAFVQLAVAIGVIAGAAAAGRWVPLAQAKRMLAAGVLFGVLVVAVAFTTTLAIAVPLLVVIGVVGGLMVVPLNALLQQRGNALMSSGRSIAVQGASENASVLACVGTYTALLALDVPLLAIMTGLGLGVAAALGALIARDRQRGGLGAITPRTAGSR